MGNSADANSSLTKLRVLRDADNIILTWPTTFGGMLLETTNSPDADASWEPVASRDQSTSNRFVLRLEPGKSAVFFGLRKTP